MEDKLSIKTLLFTKAIANHEIPVPVNGHKIFCCTDCGDKFIFESSYNDHVNRKSVHITYTCRSCNQVKIFFNRCNLLNHIRLHAFKTATINVNDLKLEPLPLNFFKIYEHKKNNQPSPVADLPKNTASVTCFECKKNVMDVTGIPYKNRAHHYNMQYTNEMYSCPICMFTLPTICGLKAHMRIHLNLPPYFCSECGINLPNKSIRYPYAHDCDGFKTMRVNIRLSCPAPGCLLLHPNEFTDHMKTAHLKKVYKCPFCVVACFNKQTIDKHLEGHNSDASKALIFHQCEICPGRLVVQRHLDGHLLSHAVGYVFPCKHCGLVLKTVYSLISHHIDKHPLSAAVKNVMTSLFKDLKPTTAKAKRVYRVVKRCEQCKRNFTYKCKYNEIPVLPNECPFKCTSTLSATTSANSKNEQITCHLCKVKISQNWEEIKKHYKKKHKNHRCLDAEVSIKRLSVKECMKFKKKQSSAVLRKLRSRKPKESSLMDKDSNQKTTSSVTNPTSIGEHACSKCEFRCDTKELLETHMKNHRDPCMAYQCMECGQSFVVKPSFSKHLLLEHSISDVDEYVTKKQCYNENALEKYQDVNISNEPLKENQCKICREQFENSEDLQKHFRGHGMAFLLKSTGNKANP